MPPPDFALKPPALAMKAPTFAERDRVLSYLVRRVQRKARLPIGAELETDYIGQGYIDSMELISFVADIEAEFAVTLYGDDVASDEFRTIGGLAGLLMRRMA